MAEPNQHNMMQQFACCLVLANYKAAIESECSKVHMALVEAAQFALNDGNTSNTGVMAGLRQALIDGHNMDLATTLEPAHHNINMKEALNFVLTKNMPDHGVTYLESKAANCHGHQITSCVYV